VKPFQSSVIDIGYDYWLLITGDKLNF